MPSPGRTGKLGLLLQAAEDAMDDLADPGLVRTLEDVDALMAGLAEVVLVSSRAVDRARAVLTQHSIDGTADNTRVPLGDLDIVKMNASLLAETMARTLLSLDGVQLTDGAV